MISEERIKELQKIAYDIRLGALEAVYNAASGHPGGSLSIAEILAYLYFEEMRVNPEEPKAPERDRLVLSKGHTSPALYAALANRGYFPVEELKNFRQTASFLQGHPDMKGTPGVDMTTGSLGQGVSVACGMALGNKMSPDKAPFRVYAVMGDGESQEGQIWEAAMFAAHYKLDNLCVFLDFNGLQIDGKITDVMNPTPYDTKFEAFGWHVISIDAHDIAQIAAAVEEAKSVSGKPTIVIAHSVKGRGVSFMENNANWHGAAPNAEQYAQAVEELRAAQAAI